MYIDRSVLLENIPLVKFIQNYIRDSSGVFSISSLVRIFMTSSPDDVISWLFVQTVSEKMANDIFVYMIKRKLHGGLKILIHFLVLKTIFYSLRSFVKCYFVHSKLKFISSRQTNIFGF